MVASAYLIADDTAPPLLAKVAISTLLLEEYNAVADNTVCPAAASLISTSPSAWMRSFSVGAALADV